MSSITEITRIGEKEFIWFLGLPKLFTVLKLKRGPEIFQRSISAVAKAYYNLIVPTRI